MWGFLLACDAAARLAEGEVALHADSLRVSSHVFVPCMCPSARHGSASGFL